MGLYCAPWSSSTLLAYFDLELHKHKQGVQTVKSVQFY